MRVRRLQIEHFRGIRNLALDFPASGPTVLFGKNGAGKTAILDALALGLQQVVGRVYRLGPTHGIPEEDVSNRMPAGAEASIQVDLQAGEELFSIESLQDSGELSADFQLELEIGRLAKWFGVKLTQHVGLPILAAYGVARASRQEALPPVDDPALFKPQLAYVDALGDGTARFAPFLRWFLARENYENERFREDQRYVDPQLEAVRRAIAKLTGFERPRIRRSPSPRLVVTKDGEELVINQLSDGERNLLALAGDLARRLALANANSSDPLAGSGIVLIDEIELHLHPAWQRCVLAKLGEAFPGCQFITASHSPQVMGEVHREGILLLLRSGDEVNVAHPQGAYGLDSNTILEFMGASPRSLAVHSELAELFRLIDEGRLEEARALRRRIESDIGPAEPELAKADTLLWLRGRLGGETHPQG